MVTANEAKIEAEVEVVQAVYGDDCVVIDSYPPHLHVHIKPRTADVSSQQVFQQSMRSSTTRGL
jgi:E3 ubiquitin-protein ligase RNF25